MMKKLSAAALLLLCALSQRADALIVGYSRTFGGAQTAWSTTLTNNSGTADAWINRTHRTVLQNISAGGTQIRVTIEAAGDRSSAADNISIGIQSGTIDTNTTATPVELLISGGSGYSLSAGQSITTDWANLTTSIGDDLVFIIDFGGSNGNVRFATGVDGKYKDATNSYNLATEPASMTNSDFYISINKVEVQ